MEERQQQLEMFEGMDRTLFPASMTLRALRDSRYHNTAYAIAELIDNSIEADAGRIELLCMEETTTAQVNMVTRLTQLGVLDDGSGMTPQVLFEALKFGGGTRHHSLRGIGKYGMGLPTASMSQCKRVDVWTWQGGVDSAWHAYIDADEIEAGQIELGDPDRATPIPEIWRRVGGSEIWANASGTLVIWRNLDKVRWATGDTLIKHAAQYVGRIHRHFIYEGEAGAQTSIRAKAFRRNNPTASAWVQFLPNDPLYLMAPSQVPEEYWAKTPMFEPFGKPVEYKVRVDGKVETITVKYSIVKKKALETTNPTHRPGDEPRGKDAAHNIGVSVVREGREVILDRSFQREGGSAENPQNRWWGCEILFNRNCDDVFGVDHNKQMVANFTQAARELTGDDRARQTLLKEMGISDDDIIYRIVGDVRDQTRVMMSAIRKLFGGLKPIPSPDPGVPPTPAGTAEGAASVSDEAGFETGVLSPTPTDRDRVEKAPDVRKPDISEVLEGSGMPVEEADILADGLIREGISYHFVPTELDAYQMFNVRMKGGVRFIGLNVEHNMFDLLQHVEGKLNEDNDEEAPGYEAIVALRLLLAAWARMVDERESPADRTHIQYLAGEWGRHADRMFSQWRDRTG